MCNQASNLNTKTNTLDIIINLWENINCIIKFGLPPSINPHITSQLILHDAHINDPIVTLDIELNFSVLYYQETYQFSKDLIIYYMLNNIYEEFYKWRYTGFGRLNWYIRQVLKKIFITKRIYIDWLIRYVYLHFANLIINIQSQIWYENNLQVQKDILNIKSIDPFLIWVWLLCTSIAYAIYWTKNQSNK